jgi:microcin C transport system substrate-binding protein
MVAALVVFLAGCGGGGSSDGGKKPPAPEPAAPVEDPAVKATEIPKVEITSDAKAGDPSVPAELGGPGFTGEGWTTAKEVYRLGDPTAPQGGSLRTTMPDWPATLRLNGENSNTAVNYTIATLMGESLLSMDPVTMDYVPSIASHWQISEDRTTYRYRIDPRARFSDGTPITAEDVVATWRLQVSTGIREPSSVLVFGKLEEPKAVSKYIVEVKTKEESWRNFLYFSTSMAIMKAAELGTLTDSSPGFQASGEAYLNTFQFAYPVYSGPYVVKAEDVKTGDSIAVTRDRSWWRESDPVMDGWFNLDRIEFVVVKDAQLGFEKVKKGEIDYYVVSKAQWWAEEVPALDDVKRGLLVPRKFYTEAPIGTSGLALNSERPPLDDDNVRLALQHLYDRETFIDKLFFHEYEPLTSYHQGSTYANPNNPLLPYDEVAAVELLEKSGWKEKNADGYRTKDGKELHFTVSYRSQLSERYLTLFQESCKRAGIRLELQLLNDSTAWKNTTERAFEITEMSWGGLVFPNPETSWSSKLADQKDNNNITAFRDARVDELLGAYDREYDVARRQEIIREIDGLIYAKHPYVLGWYSPAQRVLYWNKFGMPAWGSPRVATSLGTTPLFLLWWVDPQRESALGAAKASPDATLEREPKEVRFWRQWAAARGLTASGTESMGGQ